MNVVRRIRAGRLQKLFLDQQEFYSKDWSPDAIRNWQLDRFNAEWQSVCHDVPFFRHLQQKGLPLRFSSWQEFKETMPVMDRKMIQKNREALTSSEKKPDFMRTTGGSTAEPIQIPAWNSELEFATKDMWYARSWFGINPSDKLFLIWGHSHLLGKGFRGWLNGTKRQLKDAILGYYRCSAYDLSEQSLQKAAENLLAFQPDYVISYAVALDRFARVNQNRSSAFCGLKLKAAIATAESFPRIDSTQFIADTLGCPVTMEYGSVETGLIAHQKPEGRYRVFWRHYFLEGQESQHLPGTYELLVTSLYPRCFPLVRYKIGDLVSLGPDDKCLEQTFEAVIGRCNDFVVSPKGNLIHSEAFSHAIKETPFVLDFQVLQSNEGAITLNYVTAKPLDSHFIEEIRGRLNRIAPDLADINIECVESIEQTIAGKTRRIVREK